MFYHLLYPLHSIVPGFNVFRYLTFRTAYAILTGLILSLFLGPWVIRQLRRYQIGETIREDGPKSHQHKAGTPTMGGVLILMALSLPTVLWSDLTNRYVWLLLSATFAFAAIGFVDDWLKLARVRRQGMRIEKTAGPNRGRWRLGMLYIFLSRGCIRGNAHHCPILQRGDAGYRCLVYPIDCLHYGWDLQWST